MAANPYEAPRSRVADIDQEVEEFQNVRMWSASGRIGRLRYLAYNAGASLVAIAAISVLTVTLGPIFGAVVAIAAYVALVVFGILVAIQRSHDMDWSGWTVLLMIIPLAGLIWMFKSGSKSSNTYGNPPPPNTTGVKILALVLPLIAGIGILAAIALPAYQQYVERAQMQQQ